MGAGKCPAYFDIKPIESIGDMLKQKADAKPEGIAFQYSKGRDKVESKTYREVYQEVQKAASWIEENYGQKQHIAVIGENSYEWLLAFFSVLCSGNVAVAIDKELPAAEVAWMIDKAEAKAVFISKTYSDLAEGIEGLKLVTLKGLQDAAKDRDASYELYRPDKKEPAAIFFTSGTSGTSKGVILSHGNLAAEVSECSRMFNSDGLKTALAVLPFHHTYGLNVAVFMPYHMGVTVYLNKSLKRLPEDMLLAKADLTMMVPLFIESFYKKIMDGISKSGKEKKVKTGIFLSNLLMKLGIDKRRDIFKEILAPFGGNLRIIIAGGAFLDQMYVKALRPFGIDIYNGFGATECSPCIAFNRPHFNKDGSVGQIIPGTQVRTSADGEVEIKGSTVMMGYYNNPEATAEALHDGWYATGDLGHVDEDGYLFLTGRKKNLIILSNGENISPEELENDFRKDPGVNEVMVYDSKNAIVAQIYPEEAYMGKTEYFNELMKKVNEGRPIYKQVSKVILRTEDFIRNTTKKVVRYKNIPKEDQ